MCLCWCLSIIELKNARWNTAMRTLIFLHHLVYNFCIPCTPLQMTVNKSLLQYCVKWVGNLACHPVRRKYILADWEQDAEKMLGVRGRGSYGRMQALNIISIIHRILWELSSRNEWGGGDFTGVREFKNASQNLTGRKCFVYIMLGFKEILQTMIWKWFVRMELNISDWG